MAKARTVEAVVECGEDQFLSLFANLRRKGIDPRRVSVLDWDEVTKVQPLTGKRCIRARVSVSVP